MTAPEFPILGTEPIAVELANTRYGAEPHDFLRTARLVDQWFAEIARHHDVPAPARHTTAEAARVRALRDHLHALFSASAENAVADPAAVAAVNRCVAAGPPALALTWTSEGTRRAGWTDTGAGVAAVLGRIATNAIELLTAPDGIARCTGPGCSLVFVRTHARRRFCHPSCGHRDRQARYYRRTRSTR
jgi:predicted RNA-binding Zn ribbon-like protein